MNLKWNNYSQISIKKISKSNNLKTPTFILNNKTQFFAKKQPI